MANCDEPRAGTSRTFADSPAGRERNLVSVSLPSHPTDFCGIWLRFSFLFVLMVCWVCVCPKLQLWRLCGCPPPPLIGIPTKRYPNKKIHLFCNYCFRLFEGKPYTVGDFPDLFLCFCSQGKLSGLSLCDVDRSNRFKYQLRGRCTAGNDTGEVQETVGFFFFFQLGLSAVILLSSFPQCRPFSSAKESWVESVLRNSPQRRGRFLNSPSPHVPHAQLLGQLPAKTELPSFSHPLTNPFSSIATRSSSLLSFFFLLVSGMVEASERFSRYRHHRFLLLL